MFAKVDIGKILIFGLGCVAPRYRKRQQLNRQFSYHILSYSICNYSIPIEYASTKLSGASYETNHVLI